MFTAFFDASGKRHGNKSAMVVAGSVSDVKKWKEFSAAWNDILLSEDVSGFHMTDFVACTKEFLNKWNPDNPEDDKRRRCFFKILLSTAIKKTNKRFSVIVVLQDYEKVNRLYEVDEEFGCPYALGGFIIVRKVLKWSQRHGDPPIQFFFEAGDDGENRLKALLRKKLTIEPKFARKGPHMRPFEAADIVAWESNEFISIVGELNDAGQSLDEPEGLFRESFLELDRHAHDWGVVTEEELVKICASCGVRRRAKPLSSAIINHQAPSGNDRRPGRVRALSIRGKRK